MITRGEREEDEFDVEYHNFDNPLYAEGGAAAHVQGATPEYNRTVLPGPRGQTNQSRVSAFLHSSNDQDSNVPAPLQYAYVSVSQEVSRSNTTATRESSSANHSHQQDGIYESVK